MSEKVIGRGGAAGWLFVSSALLVGASGCLTQYEVRDARVDNEASAQDTPPAPDAVVPEDTGGPDDVAVADVPAVTDVIGPPPDGGMMQGFCGRYRSGGGTGNCFDFDMGSALPGDDDVESEFAQIGVVAQGAPHGNVVTTTFSPRVSSGLAFRRVRPTLMDMPNSFLLALDVQIPSRDGLANRRICVGSIALPTATRDVRRSFAVCYSVADGLALGVFDGSDSVSMNEFIPLNPDFHLALETWHRLELRLTLPAMGAMDGRVRAEIWANGGMVGMAQMRPPQPIPTSGPAPGTPDGPITWTLGTVVFPLGVASFMTTVNLDNVVFSFR